MQTDTPENREVLKTHPDGTLAVCRLIVSGESYFEAVDPQGLSLGAYDTRDEAESAALWAWEFLQEDCTIKRLTLMELIMQKLRMQYPDESEEATLQPKE
ncbi:MAG TPA: hypothetical protein VIP51_03420 [Eoetvoesiella sp.]